MSWSTLSGMAKWVVLAAGLIAGQAWSADTVLLPNLSHEQTVGSVSCASSLCHGATVAWQGGHVLQNEYTTWSRLDQHTRTYAVLLNDKSKEIAQKLGLEKPAHQSKVCLDCHAHNPPQELRGERFVQSEGVGCEACHGPAGRWLKSHTVEGASHSANIARGLYPTDQPVAQAKLCLSCHNGDQSRYVTHRMMSAGHPRLSFELGTFSSIEPSHVRIDDDWRRRHGDYNPIKIWAIGQVVASQQMLTGFADPKLGKDGIFPELIRFDCYACHHTMTQEKWTNRLGVGPGRVRLNDSSLLMLRAIIRAIDLPEAPTLSRKIHQLHQAVSGEGDPEGRTPEQAALQLANYLDRYTVTIQKEKFDAPQLARVLNGLFDEALNGDLSDYAGAEQAYMAISGLSASMVQLGSFKSPKEVNQQLAALRKILLVDERYDPKQFASQLAAFKSSLSSQSSFIKSP